jgi:hypothetical protein
MLYFETPSVLKMVRRARYSWGKRLENIKSSPHCIFFPEDLPIAMTFGYYLNKHSVNIKF